MGFTYCRFLFAGALALPLSSQGPFDAVAYGREVFSSMGCVECHVVEKGDKSMKTGPNLYGLFLTQPRTREVGVEGGWEKVKADKDYFINSVRQSWDQLAVAENGPAKGATYPQVMPQYGSTVITGQDLEALWHYLRTLAEEGEAGPAKVMLTREKTLPIKHLIDVPGEIPVTDRPRVFRAMLSGTSGRALHVGLPNGMSYTFDPRMLSVRRVWSGGFLNLHEERSGRDKRPSTTGWDAVVFLEDEPLLAPLTRNGIMVDFEFKEPDVQDHPEIGKYLRDGIDFATRLASLDAEFRGHQLEPESGLPTFEFRVGKNVLTESITLAVDGGVEIRLEGNLAEAQSFRLRSGGLAVVTVDGGRIANGLWKLPASSESKVYRLKAKIPGVVVARPIDGRPEIVFALRGGRFLRFWAVHA